MTPGTIFLIANLAERFGKDALHPAPGIVRAETGQPTVEVRLPVERMDDASMFCARLACDIEDRFGEGFSVIVVPT